MSKEKGRRSRVLDQESKCIRYCTEGCWNVLSSRYCRSTVCRHSGSQTVCAHEGDLLAGSSICAVWWRGGLWQFPGYSQLCGHRDVEGSRAVGLSPGVLCSQICIAHCSAPPSDCFRGTFRDIVTGTSWILLWVMMAEEAWGPRAARVGPERLGNSFISVELALHAGDRTCRLQLLRPSVAITYLESTKRVLKGQEPQTFQSCGAV